MLRRITEALGRKSLDTSDYFAVKNIYDVSVKMLDSHIDGWRDPDRAFDRQMLIVEYRENENYCFCEPYNKVRIIDRDLLGEGLTVKVPLENSAGAVCVTMPKDFFGLNPEQVSRYVSHKSRVRFVRGGEGKITRDVLSQVEKVMQNVGQAEVQRGWPHSPHVSSVGLSRTVEVRSDDLRLDHVTVKM